MILSNRGILDAIKKKHIEIGNLKGNEDPSQHPFNTTAVDLHLNSELVIPNCEGVAVLDVRQPGLPAFLKNNSKRIIISDEQPYQLEYGKFILAQTIEKVHFPILPKPPRYSARVEGKSSRSRCGILVHFTAPTIHAGFRGPITLEIINFGHNSFLLFPKMEICQLIIEQVCGEIEIAPSQFMDQVTPEGTK
jgi:dCTP deaminase